MGSKTDRTYEVHLTEELSADVTSPVTTDRLDFYDSGVWAHGDAGRDFFPYERVAVIRELPAQADEAAAAETAESTADDDEATTDETAESTADDDAETGESDVDTSADGPGDLRVE
jgi:hypothetical protein